MGEIERHIISSSASITEALKALNNLSGARMTLFVTDCDGHAVGSLTDGDIRRGLIAGIRPEESVTQVMHKAFGAIRDDDNAFQTIRSMRQKGISMLPRIDADGKITQLIDLTVTRSMLPIDAVLMAGGKGERLRPLTLEMPKPLLKIGDKAIIDYNIDELITNGIDNIFVTVNYLREQIEHHFSSPRQGVKVKTVPEPQRMGTIGSLSLVDGLKHDNILLMNSDILTTLDFEEMYLHHVTTESDLTIATIPYTISIPYAILRLDGESVKGLEEKPTYNYFANAGIYLMRRELTELLPKNEYLDAPDFIEMIIQKHRKVTQFPINGTWIDIGSPSDFRYAQELMNRPK